MISSCFVTYVSRTMRVQPYVMTRTISLLFADSHSFLRENRTHGDISNLTSDFC